MKAKLIMNPHPMTLRPTDTVAIAAERILKHHLRHLPMSNTCPGCRTKPSTAI